MNPFEIMDAMHRGDWETCFPDPVKQDEFVEFLNDARFKFETGILVRYDFESKNDGMWAAWQHFTFEPLITDRMQCEAIYLPNEDVEDKVAPPDGMENFLTYIYEWPEGIDHGEEESGSEWILRSDDREDASEKEERPDSK